MRRWWFRGVLALCWLAASCGGDDFSLGLTGCDGPQPAFEATAVNTVEGAGHGTVTAAGIEFLVEQREQIVGLLFDVDAEGRVRLPLPAFDFGDRGRGLGVGVREMQIGLDLRAMDLEVEFLPDPTRLRVRVRDARLSLEDGVVAATVGGDAACRIGNGLRPGQPDAALIELDFTIDVFLAVDPEGRFQVDVDVLPFTVHALDFELLYDPDLPECSDGVTSAECRLTCGVGDAAAALAEALYDAFDTQLNVLLRPLVERLVNYLAEGFTERPLAVEGALHPRVIAALLPTAVDSHPIAFEVGPSPAGLTVRADGQGGDGLGLTFGVGLDAVDHPCVPPTNAPPPLVAGPAPVLSGYDHEGLPYHVGISLSDAAVNRAVWVAYRGGALCAALDSEQIEALTGIGLDTAAMSLILPGLDALTLGARPIRIALDPAFEASDLPLARFFPVEDDGGIPQAGVRVALPRLGLSIYGLVEARWSRLFAAEVSVEADVVVQAAPGERLVLTLAQPRVSDLRQTYNELLSGADVPALLDLVADLLASSLLRDGLSLELPLAGLVSGATGLPLDAHIAALRVDGAEGDFLSVLLSLVPVPAGAGLAPAAETEAEVLRAEPGRVELGVRSTASSPRFQTRLDDGPWRPLGVAPGGRLLVAEPGLRVLGDHRIAVRAVAEGAYASLDPSPAVVSVAIAPLEAAPPPPPPRATAPAGGCSAVGGGGGAPLGLLGLLLLLGLSRRRAVAAAIGLLGLLAGAGCDDRPAAARIACDRSADCPGGLTCVEGACVRPDLCETQADCCPGAACRAGACVAPEPACGDGLPCADAAHTCVDGRCLRSACDDDAACPGDFRCLGGACHREPPCRAACGVGGACYAALDACRPAPPGCAGVCPEGTVRVVDGSAAYLGATCDLSGATCSCVNAPALVPADFGRHASMALLRGEPVFAAWDADYGDLVYVTGVEAGRPELTYLDGVPPEAPVLADPTGPRGGRAAPGPDRGRFASLAIDGKGRPHIAYYDATEGDLRYIRGRVDGGWGPPMVVDAEGDVGRYAVMAVDRANQPRILYHAAETGDGRAGVRLAYAPEDPTATGDWTVLTLQSRPLTEPPPEPGLIPRAPGVMPCMRVGVDGQVYAAWYDGEQRWPYLARGRPGEIEGWTVSRLVGERSPEWPDDPGERYANFLGGHDVGRFCDLVYDPAGDGVMAVFADATTDALVLYQGPVEGGGVFELVDPGGRGLRRLVGADPALAQDARGRPVVAYQDATENNVLLAVRAAGRWNAVPTRALAEGGVGFYNSLVVVGDEAVIGTLELRTRADGRGAHRLRVVRLAVPDF